MLTILITFKLKICFFHLNSFHHLVSVDAVIADSQCDVCKLFGLKKDIEECFIFFFFQL